MVVRLIGAGLPRTGTTSLKAAIERLTGGPCYHMESVLERPDHPAMWSRVLAGDLDVLDRILDGFTAGLDWPMSSLWREAAERYPDAAVLLSHRADADTWWRSADETVFAVWRSPRSIGSDDWWEMSDQLLARFTSRWDDEAAAKAAYEQHLDDVRSTIAPERLVEYRPGDGWEPICRALHTPVPDETFPHLNSTDEFRARLRPREM